MRGHCARECGVARVCTRASRMTLSAAVSSPPVLCAGPSGSWPPRVGPAEPCLGSRAHERCAAPMRCSDVLPLRYADAATMRSRGEALSRFGCCVPRCLCMRAPPCLLSHARGRAKVVAIVTVLTWKLPCPAAHLPRARAAAHRIWVNRH